MTYSNAPLPPSPPSAPPPPMPAPAVWASPQAPVVQGKSRAVAAALALLFGGLGIHKFYMGKVALGVIYLVFVWTYIPSFIGWIEGIVWLAKSDESWASEHGWPLQRSNGAAIVLLWVLAILPFLGMVSIIALLFLGGAISGILETTTY